MYTLPAAIVCPWLLLQIIRGVADSAAAKSSLQSRFQLSDRQVEGVLGLTLRRLTALEGGKLREEEQQLQGQIAQLQVRGTSCMWGAFIIVIRSLVLMAWVGVATGIAGLAYSLMDYWGGGLLSGVNGQVIKY